MDRWRGVRRADDGSFTVSLEGGERDVLADLPRQLRAALDAGEPTLYRLFPPAFTDDDEANVEYASLVGRSLEDGKRAALAELERTAHAETLAPEEAEAWLGAIESLRLALGTQLNVTEETFIAELDSDDPELPRYALYHWLSWLQEEVVSALASALP
ncbi:MAG: DUF2017 family protein [Gaiellales bacterium]